MLTLRYVRLGGRSAATTMKARMRTGRVLIPLSAEGRAWSFMQPRATRHGARYVVQERNVAGVLDAMRRRGLRVRVL